MSKVPSDSNESAKGLLAKFLYDQDEQEVIAQQVEGPLELDYTKLPKELTLDSSLNLASELQRACQHPELQDFLK